MRYISIEARPRRCLPPQPAPCPYLSLVRSALSSNGWKVVSATLHQLHTGANLPSEIQVFNRSNPWLDRQGGPRHRYACLRSLSEGYTALNAFQHRRKHRHRQRECQGERHQVHDRDVPEYDRLGFDRRCLNTMPRSTSWRGARRGLKMLFDVPVDVLARVTQLGRVH